MSVNRKAVLLRAAFDMIRKAEMTPVVESPLEITTYYDGADCDGLCLADDIATELDIERDSDPLEEPPVETPPMFVLYSIAKSRGGCVLFWNPGSQGYTADLDEAGRFSEEEARRICKDGSTTIPIPECRLGEFRFKSVVNLNVDGNHDVIGRLINAGKGFLSTP